MEERFTAEMRTTAAGTMANTSLVPLKFGGHCYYVVKCVRGKQVGDDYWRREIGGIEIPQSYTLRDIDPQTGETTASGTTDCVQRTCWVKVLAVGPRVGQPCTKEHARKFERPRVIPNGVMPGDLLLCPNTHPGISLSPLARDEFFIEESVPRLIKPRGTSNE